MYFQRANIFQESCALRRGWCADFCLHYVLTGLIFCGFETVKNMQINLFFIDWKGS
jgi:hypothetical protein